MVMDNKERYRGAMLGLAVGDAIGCPVEGLKAGHIQQLYGRIEGYVDPAVKWKKSPHRWRISGLYSDDTQQALALADSLVKCRGFSAEHFAKILVDMTRAIWTGGRFGAHRGTGGNFRASVQALMEGADPAESGQPSAGIGAMMRVAPCGLYFAGEEDAILRSAIEQSLVTHRDPRSLVMAALVAHAISRSVTGAWDGSKQEDRVNDILEAAEEAERLVEKDYLHRIPVVCMDRLGLARSAVSLLPRLLELLEQKMVLKQIVVEANRQFPEHKITEPGQGFVMAAGLTSLYFALTATNYEEAVLEVVRLGKDTDTMAAIVGSVTGARFGESSIPENWLRGLVNAEQVGLRGEALFEKSFSGLAIKEVVAMEAELTKKEEDERRTFFGEELYKKEGSGHLQKRRKGKKCRSLSRKCPAPATAGKSNKSPRGSKRPGRNKTRKVDNGQL
jgi:ADP-ribosylglycohydrolase